MEPPNPGGTPAIDRRRVQRRSGSDRRNIRPDQVATAGRRQRTGSDRRKNTA